jgi:MFS family permease
VLLGSTIAFSFSESTTWLVVGRALHGLSSAVAGTIPPTIVTDRVGVEVIGRYLGCFVMARSLGVAAGTIVGALLCSYYGDCVLRAYSRRDSTTASGRWTHTGYQRQAVGKAQDTRCLIYFALRGCGQQYGALSSPL